MISISPIEDDGRENVIIFERPESRLRAAESRFSRTATLDGDVIIDHRGFSHGDRDFDIVAEITEAQENALWDIFENETIIKVACKEGVFDAVIDRLKVDNGDLDMTIRIKEKKE